MGILKTLFRKRQPIDLEENSLRTVSSDKMKVIIETTYELSEEQKNTIMDIVREGVIHEEEESDICIYIALVVGAYSAALIIKDNVIIVVLS